MAAGPVGFVPCRGEQKEQKEEHKTQTKGVGQLAVKMATLSISSPSSSSSVQAKPVVTPEQQKAARAQQLATNVMRNAKLVYEAVHSVIDGDSKYIKEYSLKHDKSPEGTYGFLFMGINAGIRAKFLIEQAQKLSASLLPKQTVLVQKSATLVLPKAVELIKENKVTTAYLEAIARATGQKGDAVKDSPLVIAHVFDVTLKNPLS